MDQPAHQTAHDVLRSLVMVAVYVPSAKQHRRDRTASQRAAVPVAFMPRTTEDINRKRIEKIRQAGLGGKRGRLWKKSQSLGQR